MKNTKSPINITTAALKLAHAPGMTLETLCIMLQAERQQQFKDEMTDMYINALGEAIVLLESKELTGNCV
jgi:hypothetical protein